jgi:hypothetical protein
MITLRELKIPEIRARLIRFYEKNTLDACRFCLRHDDAVDPAVQIEPEKETEQ